MIPHSSISIENALVEIGDVLNNSTLYDLALTDRERDSSFKWHSHAYLERSSQVFCLSALGSLRNLDVGNKVLNDLLSEAFQEISLPDFIEWKISPEYEDKDILNEKGTPQPSSVDCFCESPQMVVCIEPKFVSDAKSGFGSCNQVGKKSCAGYYGPGSDLKNKTNAWCRLKVQDGSRTPRFYWCLGRSYFRHEIFTEQVRGDTCPFAGPSYQLMRNFLFAAETAKRNQKEFFGVLTICPEQTADKIKKQVQNFRDDVLLPEYEDRLQFIPYERLIYHLRATYDGDALKFADFLEERISKICS